MTMKHLLQRIAVALAACAAIAGAQAEDGVTPTTRSCWASPPPSPDRPRSSASRCATARSSTSTHVNRCGRRQRPPDRDEVARRQVRVEAGRREHEEADRVRTASSCSSPTSARRRARRRCRSSPRRACRSWRRSPVPSSCAPRSTATSSMSGRATTTRPSASSTTSRGPASRRSPSSTRTTRTARPGLEGMKRAMAKRNLQIAALGTVERNTTAVADAVKTINAAQPEATVMISAYTSVAEFVKQMKKERQHLAVLQRVVRRQQGARRRARQRGLRRADLAGRAVPVEPADADRQGVPRPRQAGEGLRREFLEPRGIHRRRRCWSKGCAARART